MRAYKCEEDQKVKRLPTIALSAGFTPKVYTVNLCSLSEVKDPQRLNAKDLSWFVGFVEGDGFFSVNKNGKCKYAKYEFTIKVCSKLSVKCEERVGRYT